MQASVQAKCAPSSVHVTLGVLAGAVDRLGVARNDASEPLSQPDAVATSATATSATARARTSLPVLARISVLVTPGVLAGAVDRLGVARNDASRPLARLEPLS